MIFEIFNTILLLCSLAINIKILNITHNIQSKNKIQNPSASLADMAVDMMSCNSCNSCDSCEARVSRNSCDSREARANCDSRDSRKENNVSQSVGVDNENVNVNLLGNDRQGESREWTEIQISK